MQVPEREDVIAVARHIVEKLAPEIEIPHLGNIVLSGRAVIRVARRADIERNVEFDPALGDVGEWFSSCPPTLASEPRRIASAMSRPRTSRPCYRRQAPPQLARQCVGFRRCAGWRMTAAKTASRVSRRTRTDRVAAAPPKISMVVAPATSAPGPMPTDPEAVQSTERRACAGAPDFRSRKAHRRIAPVRYQSPRVLRGGNVQGTARRRESRS